MYKMYIFSNALQQISNAYMVLCVMFILVLLCRCPIQQGRWNQSKNGCTNHFKEEISNHVDKMGWVGGLKFAIFVHV